MNALQPAIHMYRLEMQTPRVVTTHGRTYTVLAPKFVPQFPDPFVTQIVQGLDGNVFLVARLPGVIASQALKFQVMHPLTLRVLPTDLVFHDKMPQFVHEHNNAALDYALLQQEHDKLWRICASLKEQLEILKSN